MEVRCTLGNYLPHEVTPMKGIGVDIVETARIERIVSRWGDRFARRIFGASELQEFADRLEQAAFISRQFAAKEAIAKALGTGMRGVHFSDIEVFRHQTGAPFVKLQASAKARALKLAIKEVHISISDEHDYAVAFAIAD